MSDHALQGGCLCGQVRYRITQPPRIVSHCHCGLCRRVSGAAFVTWVTVRRDSFALTGELTWYESSEWGRRGFCAACGTHVVSGSTEYLRYYDVTAGSLDDPNLIAPERHVFANYKLDWVELADDLPRHGESGHVPRPPNESGKEKP